MAERRADNPTWTELEAARVVKGHQAATGEWWISMESYSRVHEHWAETNKSNPEYTLNDAFRDKLALKTDWSHIGYDQTMVVKADFPVPCLRGMGNSYPRNGDNEPTGIEQIFIPKSTAEYLFDRGCYKTFRDPKEFTLDELKSKIIHWDS